MKINSKIKDILLLYIFYGILYKLANFIYLGEPYEIPKTDIDLFWSFNAHWIWVYLSSYVLLPILYFKMFYQKRQDFIPSFLLLTGLSFLIFVFIPTSIPRETYLPSDLNSLYTFIFNIIHTADGVTNCLPSLHVSTAYFICWWSGIHFKKYFPYFFLYGTTVAISTMTVKQHYFYDALAGFILSLVVVVGFKFWTKKREPQGLPS